MSLPTVLPGQHRAALTARAAAHTSSCRDARRAKIVLACADHGPRAAARRTGDARSTVAKWWTRYRRHGLDGLRDAPRSGRPRRHDDTRRRQVLTVATAQPARPYARWSPQRIALFLSTATDRLGEVFALPTGHPLLTLHHDLLTSHHTSGGQGPTAVSTSWVRSVLTDAHIKVHRVRGWLHRKHDPTFADRVNAVETAVAQATTGARTVISMDEKTAVSVRPPVHPDTLGPDGTRRREFEYRRAGTISWYGIQDLASGSLTMRRSAGRMDSAAFTMVLDDLLAEHGDDFTIIMDNGPAHTSAHTRRWLSLHPQVTALYTPVHSSWVNPVEVQFSVATTQVISGGHHHTPEDLDRDMQSWTRIRNTHTSPVRWSYQRRDERGPRTSSQPH